MPVIATKYFGNLDYSEESVFEFPAGIPGFDCEKRFLFIEQPLARPMVFMQSMAEPALCFLALPILTVQSGYSLRMSREDLDHIGLATDAQPEIGSQVCCLALVSLESGQAPTANLLAPVVANLHSRKAVQAIQVDSDYSHRHTLESCAPEAICS